MTTNEKGDVLCDHEKCEKVATVNYQTGVVRWTIDGTGYRFDEMFADGEENTHYCDEHDTGL